MLGVYAGYSLLMGAAWCPFSTIPDEAGEFYHVGEDAISLFELSFMIMYIVTAFPTSWFLNYSLRYSLLAGSLLLLSGSSLRFLAWDDYAIALTGQFLLALGNCMALSSCSTIVELWFPQHEVVLATAIASLANCVGMGLQLIVSAAVADIPIILGLVAVLSLGETLLMGAVFQPDPPHVPSSLSRSSLRSYVKNWRLMGFLLLSGAAFGTVCAFIGLIYKVLEPSGYSPLEVGVFGLVLMVSGMVGGVCSSVVLGRCQQYSRALQMYLLVGMVGSVALCVAVLSFPSMVIVTAIYGFGIIGFIPLAVRAAVEEAPDIEPSVSTNIIFFCSQVFSLANSIPTIYFQQETQLSGLYLLALCTTVSLGLFLAIYQTDISPDEAAKPLKSHQSDFDKPMQFIDEKDTVLS